MSGLLDALRGKGKVFHDDDIEEWVRHHDDPRSGQGMGLVAMAFGPMTDEELREAWQAANRLVGKRAPADYGEFLAYGYFQGRQEQARIDRRDDES